MNLVYYLIPAEGNNDMQDDELERLNKALEDLSILKPAPMDWDYTTSTMNDSIYISNEGMDTSISDTITHIDSNQSSITLGDISTITFPITGLTGSGGTGRSVSPPNQYTQINLDEYANVTLSQHKELTSRVEQLEKILAEEAELRSQHPALKMAYDEYRLLLVLAKQHTPNILTDN